MIATFILLQPGWLAVVLVLLVGAAGYGRAGRATDGGMGAPLRAGLAVLAALPAALLGAWLVYERTAAAHGLLAAFALAAAGYLTVQSYRWRFGGSPARDAPLVGLRLIAWFLVLALVARPIWDLLLVEWRKPLLVVLLDDSGSMALADAADASGPRKRCDVANQAIDRARPWLHRLGQLYEVRLFRLSQVGEPVASWQIVPRAPLSALAAALQQAARARSDHQDPPHAVLVISDGAENALDARAVRQAAAELAEQRTALLAVGVGPPVGRAPEVELEPLVLPAEIGLRDRLRVPVSARVRGCRGAAVRLDLRWGDDPSIVSVTLPVELESERVRREFDVTPPTPGLHRLTARVTLPHALGGQTVETSAVIDVQEGRVRVLLLEGAPRTEAAFAARALSGEAQLEVTREFALREPGPGDPRLATATAAWEDFDVIVLGQVPGWRLTDDALRALAEAVTRHGVGLLACGGVELFNHGDYERTALAELLPIELLRQTPSDDNTSRLEPTDEGRLHAVLRGIAGESGSGAASPWKELPPLGGAALLGPPQPLATVLATDGAGRPLLVAHEVGRGRCVAAAWESTWPWALASDAGATLHRRLWRQLVVWLANRRPRAWVLTDETTYFLAAVSAGQRKVQIRAGVSGLDTPAEARSGVSPRPTLTMRRSATTVTPDAGPVAAPSSTTTPAPPDRDATWSIPLKRSGDEWVAELPSPAVDVPLDRVGTYMLEFVVQGAAGTGSEPAPPRGSRGARDEAIPPARMRFALVEDDLERRPPTANLTLLREAAEPTAPSGGAYYDIHVLPDLMRMLAGTDRRQRVETRVRIDPAERDPWLLLAIVAAALAVEWGLRKRHALP